MADIEILVPVAPTRIAKRPLATRIAQLQNARIGWLDNMKANAGDLLREVAKTLTTQGYAFERILASKNATAAAPDAIMAHLETCDAVVLAIAD